MSDASSQSTGVRRTAIDLRLRQLPDDVRGRTRGASPRSPRDREVPFRPRSGAPAPGVVGSLLHPLLLDRLARARGDRPFPRGRPACPRCVPAPLPRSRQLHRLARRARGRRDGRGRLRPWSVRRDAQRARQHRLSRARAPSAAARAHRRSGRSWRAGGGTGFDSGADLADRPPANPVAAPIRARCQSRASGAARDRGGHALARPRCRSNAVARVLADGRFVRGVRPGLQRRRVARRRRRAAEGPPRRRPARVRGRVDARGAVRPSASGRPEPRVRAVTGGSAVDHRSPAGRRERRGARARRSPA